MHIMHFTISLNSLCRRRMVNMASNEQNGHSIFEGAETHFKYQDHLFNTIECQETIRAKLINWFINAQINRFSA